MKIWANPSPWSFPILPRLFLQIRSSFKSVSTSLRSHHPHPSHLQRSTCPRPERVKNALCSLGSGRQGREGFWSRVLTQQEEMPWLARWAENMGVGRDGPKCCICDCECRSQHAFLSSPEHAQLCWIKTNASRVFPLTERAYGNKVSSSREL